VERARKWGLPVAGHVPDTVTIDEAITARQNSMEHLMGMLLACSSDEQKIRPLRALAIEQKDGKALVGIAERTLVTFDPTKAGNLFERMARYSSYQVPTLVMLRRSAYADADDVVRDPRLKYIPSAIRKDWDDPREEKKKIPEATLALIGQQYERLAWIVEQMQRQGVPIMAGTDTGDPYTFPGYDLHRELQLLVKAGLTPAQALRSATLTPAEYLDADESLGSVVQGKIADLVLLDADPLKDIRNTQKISAVVLGGKYLSKAKLDSMLLRGRQ
jgi:imidazolonepropionase-like amidohydrolase